MRIAVLHHWFVTKGGGERVAECIAALFPGADIFSLLAADSGIPDSLKDRRIHTSFLQRIPGAVHRHRHMMPLYPQAAHSLDLRDYDLVVSSDSGPVKGARVREDAIHLCYCHSPMRYLYDGYDEYLGHMTGLTRLLFRAAVPYVRRYDRAAAQRVTGFVANSFYVAERIRRVYGRTADVIPPPIDMTRARLASPQDHYLAAGRLVGYKRTEIMIEACERLGRKLRIAGTGPDEDRLRRIAGPHTTFLGQLSDDALWDEYARCRALLFAADEDFGMVPLEVQACGRPVIAYGYGGSLETVRGTDAPVRFAPYTAVDSEAARMHPTGMYFSPQTSEALQEAILRFEADFDRFSPAAAQAHAASFDTPVFLDRMREYVLRYAPQAEASMADAATALQAVS